MEDRQRVNLILKSAAFREELEELVIERIQSGSGVGSHPANAKSLQQFPDLLLPKDQSSIYGKGMGTQSGSEQENFY